MQNFAVDFFLGFCCVQHFLTSGFFLCHPRADGDRVYEISEFIIMTFVRLLEFFGVTASHTD